MPQEIRRHFHEELHETEFQIQEMGVEAAEMVGRSMAAVQSADPAMCDEVIASDDTIDRHYLDIERRILGLFALQTPVASDLRLLTVLLHVNLHLERIGDMAVNIAKLARLAGDLPRSPDVLEYLNEMSNIAVGMVRTAMDAFARRDVDACRRLPEMDDPVDRLNRGMLKKILEFREDKSQLEWAIRMHVVSRQLERIADHAVDIGEQVAFLVTGEFREFSDASHPESNQL